MSVNRRFLLPLIIPLVVLGLVAASGVSRGRPVVDESVVSAISGAVLVAVLVGVPAFWAGYLFCRDAGQPPKSGSLATGDELHHP